MKETASFGCTARGGPVCSTTLQPAHTERGQDEALKNRSTEAKWIIQDAAERFIDMQHLLVRLIVSTGARWIQGELCPKVGDGEIRRRLEVA